MFIKEFTKICLFNIQINFILRNLLKPISIILPDSIKKRIPILGKVSIPFRSNSILKFESKGYVDGILNDIYWGGLLAYERETTELFIDILNYNKNIFDIGAYTGFYSIIAAIENNERTVYSFEAVPETLTYLKNNIKLNRLNNIKTYGNAVSNYIGPINLYIPHKGLPLTASTLEGFRDSNTVISAEAITIDSFVKRNKISNVDMLKIDTEATEDLVLEGSLEVIKTFDPIIICEVLAGRTEMISNEGLVKMTSIEGDSTYNNKDYLFISDKCLERHGDSLKSKIIQ